jgi:hypothetical protein
MYKLRRKLRTLGVGVGLRVFQHLRPAVAPPPAHASGLHLSRRATYVPQDVPRQAAVHLCRHGPVKGGRHDWFGVHNEPRIAIWSGRMMAAHRLDRVLKYHNVQRRIPTAPQQNAGSVQLNASAWCDAAARCGMLPRIAAPTLEKHACESRMFINVFESHASTLDY